MGLIIEICDIMIVDVNFVNIDIIEVGETLWELYYFNLWDLTSSIV